MKFGGILNREVSEMLASMGHGQMLIISDAGFPIPKNAWYADLAVTQDLPRVETVLELVSEELITEKIMFAKEVETSNPDLYVNLKQIFSDAPFEAIEHEHILNDLAYKAKGIIRTGAFNPWGNIVLISGTNPYQWFKKENIEVPPFYKERFEQINNSNRKEKYLK